MREDKSPEDASGPDVICQLYEKQTRKVESANQAIASKKVQPGLSFVVQQNDDEEGGSDSDGLEEVTEGV